MSNGKTTLPGGTSGAGKAHVGFEAEALMLLARLKPHARAIGVGAAAVGIAVVAGVWSLSNRQTALADGYAALQTATSADALKDLAVKYKGTPVGEQAAFAVAKHLFEAGSFDEAGSRFQLFTGEYPASTLATRARLGLAYALESGGKQAPAEKKFAAFASEITSPELSAEGYVGAGRCAQAQGKAPEAEKWFKAAVSSGASGIYRYQALEALKAFTGPAAKAVAPPAASTPAVAPVPTPAPTAAK